MIKPVTDLIVLKDDNNSNDLLSIEILKEELFNIIENNYLNHEIIEDILNHVKIRLTESIQEEKNISLKEIEQFIIRLLIESGNDCLADELCKKRDINSCHPVKSLNKNNTRIFISQKEVYSWFSGENLHICQQKIVSIPSISLLLPVVRFEINLDFFFDPDNSECLIELIIFPKFTKLCHRIKSMMLIIEKKLPPHNKILDNIEHKIKFTFSPSCKNNTMINYPMAELKKMTLDILSSKYPKKMAII